MEHHSVRAAWRQRTGLAAAGSEGRVQAGVSWERCTPLESTAPCKAPKFSGCAVGEGPLTVLKGRGTRRTSVQITVIIFCYVR